ncbi:protein CHROMATIN REMODELING 24 isoform X2 [Daucus carota subsp. sativus]|uniref:protein CHROMATIN REMODELING 24 isoform X2 n=1 Tax=Daucus carota subsp. sativus TaxID=79200 RepID=UPI0007F02758|nr:PREDICTED: protein CHROMATIN REMODELING 24 isoform X2 [Daucus carota subsp. sativus]
MAEKRTAAKEPMSLNQRHNRLLSDLSSAPHPKPPFHFSRDREDEAKVNLTKAFSSSLNLNDDDDAPTFAGISDFDPPPLSSPGGKEEAKMNVTREFLPSVTVNDDAPTFSRIGDFGSPSPPPPKSLVAGNPPAVEHHVECWSDAHNSFEEEDSQLSLSRALSSKDTQKDDAPHFSGIVGFDSPSPPCELESDVGIKVSSSLTEGEYMPSLNKVEKAEFHKFGHPPEERKPLKVKLEGRRRLCKTVSSINDCEEDDSSTFLNDEPDNSGVADFKSPPPLKKDLNSGDEIMDILHDLSAKFEVLSMEKTKRPFSTKTGLVEDLSASRMNKGTAFDKENELHKNAGPSPRPDSFGSSSGYDFSKAKVYDDVSEIRRDGGMLVNDMKNCAGDKKKNGTRHMNNHISNAGQSNNLKHAHRRKDRNDDDCVVISNHNFLKSLNARESTVKWEPDDRDNINKLDKAGENNFGNEDSIVLSDPISQFKLNGKIAKMLYPHQRDGLKWLWSLHCQGKGGILGDDMGLGKTMQICGFLAGLFHSRLIKRVLVVAPKTLLPHWIKELSAVDLSHKTREYYGTCAKAREYELQSVFQDKGILLTTYDIVRNNTKSLRGDHHFFDDEDEETWDYMILDEGHLIKNPSTQRAKSLLEIPAAHRIIISGTPIQNHLKELWALFSFCCPDLLGDKKWFKEKYENAILRGNEKNASDRDKRIGSAVAKELRERIQPYFLRRLKSEVFCDDDGTNTASLSQKHEIIVWLRLTKCQRQLYEAFLKTELVVSAFDGSPLAALTILKKICDHPLLLTKRAAEDVLEGMDSMLNPEEHGVAEKLAMHIADVTERLDFAEKHDYVSCKISFILSLLPSLIPRGHNVLIFSQTRKMLDLIQDSLISNGYKFLRIDGTTKANDRLKIVDDFQAGGAPIFLLTSQVGGLGLTLTKADRVIVVDPAWNPSTDNQSVDRAYRIGQKKDVLVYRLMTCGTVEEKIYRKQVFKGGLFKSATEHKEQIRYFSQQDLRELFSIPEQGFDVSLTQQQLHDEHDGQLKMDESLEKHLKFVESLGIAGVSHHSLLFSKTAPVAAVQEEEITRVNPNRFVSSSASFSSNERDIDGAKYAFNPKDVKLHTKVSSSNNSCSPSERDIQDRIKRLSQVFANKVMISNLPDKGDKIRKQIAQLHSELENISSEARNKNNIIDLDEISG